MGCCWAGNRPGGVGSSGITGRAIISGQRRLTVVVFISKTLICSITAGESSAPGPKSNIGMGEPVWPWGFSAGGVA